MNYDDKDLLRKIKHILLHTAAWPNARALEMGYLGFERFEKRGMLGGEVWMHPSGVVVKKAFFFTTPPPKKVVCPTIRIAFDRSGPVVREWVIQPRVCRNRRALALEAVKARLRNPDLYDLHTGNVGHWNGRPVCFDW